MTHEGLRVLVERRLDQAEQALKVGTMAFEGGFYGDAINRAYYSMFYGVSALLTMKKLETSKHQAAISLFDREFVKTGVFPREMSRWLHAAFDQRLEMDYAAQAACTMEEAETVLQDARKFVEAVKKNLDSKAE